MSLLESLLLDPARLDVWIAARVDGVKGTGTESDPYNGSVRAAAPELDVSSITKGTGGSTHVATVTTSSNHGYGEGDIVVVSGVTGSDAGLYNGTFPIYNVGSTTFQYLMLGAPAANATGASIK